LIATVHRDFAVGQSTPAAAGRFRVRRAPRTVSLVRSRPVRAFRRSYGRDPAGRPPQAGACRWKFDAASRTRCTRAPVQASSLVGGLTPAWLRAPPPARFGPASAQLRTALGRPAAGSPRSPPLRFTPGSRRGARVRCRTPAL